MIWRMTIEVPEELEKHIRMESFKTKTPFSQLVNSMLAERYGVSKAIGRKREKGIDRSRDKKSTAAS